MPATPRQPEPEIKETPDQRSRREEVQKARDEARKGMRRDGGPPDSVVIDRPPD